MPFNCWHIKIQFLVGVWYFSAELEENSTLNSKVWEAAGHHDNGTFPLDHFSYNNSALLDVMFRHLEKTNFTGVTVSVGKETLCGSKWWNR